jgi:hypothetical protein
MIRRCSLAALLIAALPALGCSSFDRLDFTFRSAPPDNASVTYEEIRIHEGIAVGVAARPMDGNEQMDNDTVVQLETKHPGVVGVATAPRDEDLEEEAPYEFVVWGIGAGEASLAVIIDGELEGEIPVVVLAQ